MGMNNKPVDDGNQPEILKKPYRPPISCFTTAWLQTDLGRFWVYVTVVGPVTEKPKRYLPFGDAKPQNMQETVTDIIEFLEEKTGG